MIISYNNGAMGHTLKALIESCTYQGGQPLPNFMKNNHLHHYKSYNNIVYITHETPFNIRKRDKKTKIIGCTSTQIFGKLLINCMGFGKWHKIFPEQENLRLYDNLDIKDFGLQVEKFSLSTFDHIQDDNRWQNTADILFDIIWFFENNSAIINFLQELNFDINFKNLNVFIKKVQETNEIYYNIIRKCFKIRDDCIDQKIQNVDITFYETCLIHCLLALHYNIPYNQIKLLTKIPNNTTEFIKLFKD